MFNLLEQNFTQNCNAHQHLSEHFCCLLFWRKTTTDALELLF